MEITTEMVDYLAGLAKLSLSEAEKEELLPKLRELLTLFEEGVNAQDVANEPLAAEGQSLKDIKLPRGVELEPILRSDEVRPSYDRESLLSNAKVRTAEAFVVPKTVEV